MHCFRLTRGADVYNAIFQYAKDQHIQAAVVVACVGCVYRWRVRGAVGEALFEGCEEAEIVSLTGTVSEYGCHMHISLALKELTVIGGHLVDGCLVNTTAEVVLLPIGGTEFRRGYDPETGYQELIITRN